MRLARMESLLARVSRRAHSKARSRAKLTIAASLIGLAGTLSAAVPAKALSTEQGTISVVGDGPSPGTCTGCNIVISGVSTGYVSGADANLQPFTVAWLAPAPATMALTVTLDSTCANNLEVIPSETFVSGTITIANAELLYKGLQMNASVTATFNTVPLANEIIEINGVDLTVTAGTISLNLVMGGPNGVLSLTPVGTNLCTASTMAASATLLSAL